MMLANQLISYIRTFVPLAVGWLLTFAAESTGVVINDNTKTSLSAAAVAVVAGLYYALARALEARWPQLGVLLGVPARPHYPEIVGKHRRDVGAIQPVLVFAVCLAVVVAVLILTGHWKLSLVAALVGVVFAIAIR